MIKWFADITAGQINHYFQKLRLAQYTRYAVFGPPGPQFTEIFGPS